MICGDFDIIIDFECIVSKQSDEIHPHNFWIYSIPILNVY